MKKYMLLTLAGLVLAGCGDASIAREQDATEKQQDVYTKTQPAPFFDWGFERHLMVKLYEARNKAVSTYSYLQSPYTGKIMSECPSLGYPIPATTQLTSPQKAIYYSSGRIVLPQPEPNGLYSPPSTSATWVMCVGPDGNVEPVYWESNVQTYPRPMKEVDGKLVPMENQKSSISIDPKRP